MGNAGDFGKQNNNNNNICFKVGTSATVQSVRRSVGNPVGRVDTVYGYEIWNR